MLLASQRSLSRGISAPHAGFGHVIVRAREVDSRPATFSVGWEYLVKLRLDPFSDPVGPLHEVFGERVLAALVWLAKALRVLQDAFLNEVQLPG